MSKYEFFRHRRGAQEEEQLSASARENSARLQAMLTEPIALGTSTVVRLTDQAHAQSLKEDRIKRYPPQYHVSGIVSDGGQTYPSVIKFWKRFGEVVPTYYSQSLEPSRYLESSRFALDAPTILVDFTEGKMTKLSVKLREEVLRLGTDFREDPAIVRDIFSPKTVKTDPLDGKGHDHLKRFMQVMGSKTILRLNAPPEISIPGIDYTYTPNDDAFVSHILPMLKQPDSQSENTDCEPILDAELKDAMYGVDDRFEFPERKRQRMVASTYTPDYFASLVNDALALIPKQASFHRVATPN